MSKLNNYKFNKSLLIKIYSCPVQFQSATGTVTYFYFISVGLYSTFLFVQYRYLTLICTQSCVISDPVTGMQQTLLIKDEGTAILLQDSPVSLVEQTLA